MQALDASRRRREKAIGRFPKEKIDALLVTSVHNVRYLSGFRGEDSALLVTPAETFLLTDARFTEQAERETRRIRIVTRRKGLMRTAAETARKAGASALGVEADAMTLGEAAELSRWTGRVQVRHTRQIVERLRTIKDASEVAAIRRAAQIAEEAFRMTLPQIRPGLTEIQLGHALDRAMISLGAEKPAFPTIVALNERASLPHARPTERRVHKGDAILLDWGATWELYNADLTRVVFLDRIPSAFQGLYSLVLAAQRRALAAVKPGRRAGAVDRTARAYLKAHRHGKHFAHGLGHGVGLEVHEAPRVGPKQSTVLKAGMVITIEPGVYVPGRGGVRIEDTVLLTREGCEALTTLPKSPPLVLTGL